MLDSLDTLIAFVLIMLVVSLLITIAVQMVSSALNLRGLNLLKGIGKAFEVILPDAATNPEQRAKDLAAEILNGRFLSDSSLAFLLKRKPKDWPAWLWPSFWRLATAIRPDEIFDAVHRIATGQRKVGNADVQ